MFGAYRFVVNVLQQKPAFAIVNVPIQLHQQRFFVRGHFPLGTTLVQLVEGVTGHAEHSHVRTEFFHQGADDVFDGGIASYPDTFSSNFLAGILKVESHNPVEFQILKVQKKNVK